MKLVPPKDLGLFISALFVENTIHSYKIHWKYKHYSSWRCSLRSMCLRIILFMIFPHDFWSPFAYLIYLLKWRFSCSLNGHVAPPPTLPPRIIIIFWTQVQSLLNARLFDKVGKHINLKIRWHNIIQIHNNVLQDLQYFTKYSPYTFWIWGIFCRMLPVPQNIVKDLNNVMDLAKKSGLTSVQ